MIHNLIKFVSVAILSFETASLIQKVKSVSK